MKIGLVVSALSESSPLKAKVLTEINGRTMLGHLLDCIKTAGAGYPAVVITTTGTLDDGVARFCSHSLVSCFRSQYASEPKSVLACAEQNGWDYVVRLNPNAVLLDRDSLSRMIAIAETGAFDLVTNRPGSTFPIGMEIEIVGVRALRSSTQPEAGNSSDTWPELAQEISADRRYAYVNRSCPGAVHLRCALETEDDVGAMATIFSRLGPDRASFTLSELVRAAHNTDRSSPWRGSSGPLLIAEIGGNHQGNFELAQDMTRLAIRSGADCIKFQLYRGDTLVSRVESPDRHSHFQRFELTMDQHKSLAGMCRQAGVKYVASVWELEMLEEIDAELPFYKIGSGDLTAWPLVRNFAKRGKPIVLSTGLSTEDEVLATVAQIQAVDARYRSPEWLCLLQCTSMYPIPDEDAHLCAMQRIRQLTGLAVGYSDHTIGAAALRTAAAMGAEVLEFHFTDSREGKTFRDHKVSLTADEVLILKRDLEQISKFRGDSSKVPQQSEIKEGHVISFRRAIYLNRSIKAGESIGAHDIALLRPANGTDARDTDRVIGSTAVRDLEAFRAIVEGDDFR